MADKPSKALVIYGYGLAPIVAQSHDHFHGVASRGCCGYLALDATPQSLPEAGDEVLLSELAQLLDARQNCNKGEGSEHESQCSVPTISERFMGMKPAIVTDSPAVQTFCEKLGFAAISLSKLGRDEAEAADTTPASVLLSLLGFENGKLSETSQFDLVFVHIGLPGKNQDGQRSEADLANHLIGQIIQASEHSSEVGSRLHLSVLASYGSTIERGQEDQSFMSMNDSNDPRLSELIPRQSYSVKGAETRTHIRQYCPMLMAQWQEAVTRRDKAKMFSFEEFRKLCGNLVIPADRLLNEIAFKLWKAPKYGA